MPTNSQDHYLACQLKLSLGTFTLGPLDFAIPPSKLTCVIGKNGAGKSTLLMALAGLVGKTAGQLLYQGHHLDKMPRDDRCQKIAWCPEALMLPHPFTVRQYIALGLFPRLKRAPTSAEMLAVDRLVKTFGLWNLIAKITHELSSGEKRKVALMQAFVGEPDTLLLDEPTSGLDPSAIAYMMQTLKGFTRKGVAVVCVLHEIAVITAFADHIIALDNGKVCFEGTPNQLLGKIEDLFGLPTISLSEEHWQLDYRRGSHQDFSS